MIETMIAATVALVGGGGIGALTRSRSLNAKDTAEARRLDADTDRIEVDTARTLIGELRAEMDRRVSELDREVGRLRGHLEGAVRERDHLRAVEAQLRQENAGLRARIERLEERITALTGELAKAATTAPGGVSVVVEQPPAPPAV